MSNVPSSDWIICLISTRPQMTILLEIIGQLVLGQRSGCSSREIGVSGAAEYRV